MWLSTVLEGSFIVDFGKIELTNLLTAGCEIVYTLLLFVSGIQGADVGFLQYLPTFLILLSLQIAIAEIDKVMRVFFPFYNFERFLILFDRVRIVQALK